MNYFVHSIMYFYYAIRASGIYRPPVCVNIFITSLQLLQMIVGVFVNMYVYKNMTSDPQWYCDGRVEKTSFFVYIAFAMYFSYFILFVNFFYTTYMSKRIYPHSKKGSDPININKETSITNDIGHDQYIQGYCPSYYESGKGSHVKQQLVFENKRSSLTSTHGLMNIGMVRH